MDRAADRALISPRSLCRAGEEAQEWGHHSRQLGCSSLLDADEEGGAGGVLLPLPPPITVTVGHNTPSKASLSWQGAPSHPNFGGPWQCQHHLERALPR